MKRLTIKKALESLSYECDSSINEDKTIEIAFPTDNANGNSLFFYTEKEGEAPLEIHFEGTKPYAAIVNKNAIISASDVPLIKIDSVRAALAYAYSALHEIDYSKLKVIGVTGTNGKTTTATLIFEILTKAGYNVGFIGTGRILINEISLTNNEYSMTTPDPDLLYHSLALMQEAGCEYVVMEVSSHSLALNKVAPIIFEYAIFTNLSDEHLDFHTSKEAYYQTKLSLFKRTKQGLFNMDDPFSRRAYNEVGCNKSSIGILFDADVYATDIKTEPLTGSNFYYRAENLMFGIKTGLIGNFNIYNILCALKCAIDLGIKPCIAKDALEKNDGISGRMEMFRSDITVIIDYAHTVDAFYNCLKTVFFNNNQRQSSTIVFGCGGNRDKSKREPMGRIASRYATKIILTEDNNRDEPFCDIIADISKGIDAGCYRVIKNRESAIRAAISEAEEGDTIAIIGKGHEKYKIENGKYIPFDERRIIEDELRKRAEAYENKA